MFTHNQFPHLKDYTTRKSNSKSTAQQQHRRRRQKKDNNDEPGGEYSYDKDFPNQFLFGFQGTLHQQYFYFIVLPILLLCSVSTFCVRFFFAAIDVDRLVNDSYNDRWLCWEITRRHLPKIRLFYGISIFFCRWRSESIADIECYEWSSAQY